MSNKLVFVVVLVCLLSTPLISQAAITTSLTIGSRGSQVTELQQTLTSLGYYSGPITGYFGVLTKAGVVKFQIANSISPSVGYFGPLSRTALNSLLANNNTTSTGTFTLISDTGGDGGILPTEYTCDGAGISPALSWSNIPAGTKEFAVIMSTIPVDGGTKWGWVLYGIPTTITSLSKASSGVGVSGVGSHGSSLGYQPPCSQGPGDKVYTFTVYALSTSPVLSVPSSQVTGEMLLNAISSITLGKASINLSHARSI
jgi:phosphatidylethanolamine-binding protein (PEBP) family uncharacterized protein